MFTLETFYKSKQWEKLREQIMQERTRDDGTILCERCGKPILRKYDCIAHHKTELTEENVNDFTISLNPDNIALIHFRCHNEEHGRFGGFSQTVFIVYGAPCAGKTTFVHDIARPDDLILDLDKIWEAICISDRRNKPDRLKANVFGIRDAIIDQIRTRTGNWRTAYIIGTYPLKTERDRLCDLLRANPLFVDTDQQTCLDRAPDEKWRQYIKNWFEDFTE